MDVCRQLEAIFLFSFPQFESAVFPVTYRNQLVVLLEMDLVIVPQDKGLRKQKQKIHVLLGPIRRKYIINHPSQRIGTLPSAW